MGTDDLFADDPMTEPLGRTPPIDQAKPVGDKARPLKPEG